MKLSTKAAIGLGATGAAYVLVQKSKSTMVNEVTNAPKFMAM